MNFKLIQVEKRKLSKCIINTYNVDLFIFTECQTKNFSEGLRLSQRKKKKNGKMKNNADFSLTIYLAF
ncbi:hypothetical protein BpHYR1_008255 [Brachionus plicatilis]|uniref:Uncharacterized protein n=1 Tax=Brachionus plicatilis TaxID=10195 RepID=A0A3M7SPK1_BRAPC|nr:hypothetical protein BpHYR1_008255 [Brachionus plicatilis]